MNRKIFELSEKFKPSGDQSEAIEILCSSLQYGNKYQTLVGVTGSGKTFTMANIIARTNKPTLIISHNKTLAAQLYEEFKVFFPNNAVEYFVSYYDYYQPEAYIPHTDTYIEKDSSINEEIEKLRISAASSLVSRKDVIVIASVSCIYGLGSPEDFTNMKLSLSKGKEFLRRDFLSKLVDIRYSRNDISFERGNFRVRGDVVDIFPAYLDTALRIEFFGNEIEKIKKIDSLTGQKLEDLEFFDLYPATSFITPIDRIEQAIPLIKLELAEQIKKFESENKLLEAQRIKMRTEEDIELLRETGFCSGIENYQRALNGRSETSRPCCLLDFFDKDSLVFIDESHVTLPQIKGMYKGNKSRKEKLIEYGFRLPSAMDNRPLQDFEFEEVSGQTIFVSATPNDFELQKSPVVAKQIIRPTGLLDPEMIVRPINGQVENCIEEIKKSAKNGERVFVTTLTKKMSEEICEFLRENSIKTEYLHSEIDAIERVEILKKLRKGNFDALIGVNLLREGLDIPEVALVCILDADKEGFLRSATSIIQTAGRAARHENGRVILYADNITQSIKKSIEICSERRALQIEYNKKHGIIPKSIQKPIMESLIKTEEKKIFDTNRNISDLKILISNLEDEMIEAAEKLQFERAALIRDQIKLLKKK